MTVHGMIAQQQSSSHTQSRLTGLIMLATVEVVAGGISAAGCQIFSELDLLGYVSTDPCTLNPAREMIRTWTVWNTVLRIELERDGTNALQSRFFSQRRYLGGQEAGTRMIVVSKLVTRYWHGLLTWTA